MIGTRLDEVDAPRLVRSCYGWWFIGNQTWTLLKPEQVAPDGTVRADAESFLRRHGAYRPRTPKSFALTVLTSTACNLGCGYCFQNLELDPSGGSRPIRIDPKRLAADTIARIIDFAADRMWQAGLDRLYLLLFGGEPLLNPRGCIELLTQASKIGTMRASMVTNGVLLTPGLADDLYTAGLRGAQVTFDGCREDHDQIRVRHSGRGTFDKIVHNLGRATQATGLRWTFRINVSHHNFRRIGDLFPQLRNRLDPSRCTVTFAWVGDAGFGYGNHLLPIDEVADAFVEWSKAALGEGFKIARPSMRTMCQICSVPGGRHGAVVNADGTLYSSWQSAGKHGMQVGTIEAGYTDPAAVADRWVTCGYEYQQADEGLISEFRDRVDGQILDYLYSSNRL